MAIYEQKDIENKVQTKLTPNFLRKIWNKLEDKNERYHK